MALTGARPVRVRKSPALVERERCAAYVEGRARAASQLLAEGKVSAETVDHVARVVALVAEDLRAGFHLDGGANG